MISGRNFQGKKKGGIYTIVFIAFSTLKVIVIDSLEVCHASIVFGLGKELYQTEEIESNDPFWNQEAHV